MRKFIIFLFGTFNRFYYWLKGKNAYGIQRSAYFIIASFIIMGVIVTYSDNEFLKEKIIYIWISLLFAFILFFSFDTDSKIVRFLTRKRYSTPRMLLRELDHCSYFYGLFLFSIEMAYFVEIILMMLSAFFIGAIKYYDYIILLLIAMFIFTFFYFSYHIYISNSEGHIENTKLQIQLYSAVGATLSFMILLIGEEKLFRIFISGTMLEYIWFQYFISKEQQIFR